MQASPLTIADPNLAYAKTVSHELAELFVDQRPGFWTAEICDPCAGNCNNLWLNFFSAADTWLGASQTASPAPFPYDFYTAAVARPRSAGRCPSPASDCAYSPSWTGFTPVQPPRTFQQLTPLTAVSRNENQLDLFAAADDGTVQTAWWNQATGWRGWAPVRPDRQPSPFPPSTPLAAVGRNPQQLDVFAVGLDGLIYTAWWNQSQGWNGWAPIQPLLRFPLDAHIAVVSRNPNQLDVFAIGNDSLMHTAWWGQANGWAGWAVVQPHTLQHSRPERRSRPLLATPANSMSSPWRVTG